LSLQTTSTVLNARVTVAIDAMGGDYAPKTTVFAALESLKKNEALSIILVGDQDKLEALLFQKSKSPQSSSGSPSSGSPFLPFIESDRLLIHHAPDVVLMDEKPTRALRSKQNSSMAVALKLVKEGRADACVSAGNTGALMLFGRSILRMCPGIDRPAITKRLPSPKGRCYVLDLGANVDSTAEHLYQFALMGSILVEAMEGIERPRVALINVGGEEIKGNEQVRLASQMLSECDGINYIGYVEGGDLFADATDVAVCDGFVGNVALKAGEGVASLLHKSLINVFKRNWYTRLLGKLVMPMFKGVLDQMDPSMYNGALFVGLQGVVVKSHGNADITSFSYAINQAVEEVEHNVPALINSRLDELLF